MKALKIILIIFCMLLAACGLYINTMYYLQHFNFYGISEKTSYILAISLVLIASLLFTISLYRKKKRNIILKITWCLFTIFSIFCSANGQYQQHLQKIAEINRIEENIKEIQADIDYYNSRLATLNQEKENLEKEKRSTIDSFEDAYNWPRNMKRNDKAQAEKEEKIVYYEGLLKIAKQKKSNIKVVTSINIFSIFGLQYQTVFKIIYQIFIALLIEIMGPAGIFGIYFFSNIPLIKTHEAQKDILPIKKPIKKSKLKKADYENQELFIEYS